MPSDPAASCPTVRSWTAHHLQIDHSFQSFFIAQGSKLHSGTLTEFFIRIGVDEKTAREDACKVEHDVSEKTFAAICAHVARQESM